MSMVFKCTHVRPVNCVNLIEGDFEDSGDDTGPNYQCHYLLV